MRKGLGLVLLSLFTGLSLPASAAPDTASPIRIVLGFSAGGSLDGVARPLGDLLRQELGQQVIIDYKTGASGRMAINEVKRARPDGLTLLLTPSSPVILYPHTFRHLEYDAFTDLTPIGLATTFDFAVTIGNHVPARSVPELLGWLRAHPAQASFGSAGAGTAMHFVGVMLGQKGGVDLVHAPYRGGAQALVDVIGGNLALVVDTTVLSIEAHRAGKARIVATTGEVRSALLPDVPTLKESGVDMVADSFIGLYAPAGTPADVVARINAALVKAVATPAFQSRMASLGMSATSSTPAEFDARMRRDLAHWKQPIMASGFHAD